MRSIKAQQGQNLWDIAIQYFGAAFGAVLIAEMNGLSLTDTLVPGQEIRVPATPHDKKVVQDLRSNAIIPATAETISGAYVQQLFENGLFENGLFE